MSGMALEEARGLQLPDCPRDLLGCEPYEASKRGLGREAPPCGAVHEAPCSGHDSATPQAQGLPCPRDEVRPEYKDPWRISARSSTTSHLPCGCPASGRISRLPDRWRPEDLVMTLVTLS